MAICLVGEAVFLKSKLEGIDIEEMNIESRCAVGFENRWTTVCFCGGSSDSFVSELMSTLLFLLSSSSIVSSVCTITVHPGGIGEWCTSRFVDLKVKPPNTGVTVYICPSASRQNFVPAQAWIERGWKEK
jgi:hypothetical protein